MASHSIALFSGKDPSDGSFTAAWGFRKSIWCISVLQHVQNNNNNTSKQEQISGDALIISLLRSDPSFGHAAGACGWMQGCAVGCGAGGRAAASQPQRSTSASAGQTMWGAMCPRMQMPPHTGRGGLCDGEQQPLHADWSRCDRLWDAWEAHTSHSCFHFMSWFIMIFPPMPQPKDIKLCNILFWSF